METYRSQDAANLDKVDLARLLDALDASPSTLRRDGNGLWILRGRPGCYACTWGDGATWQLVVTPEQEISMRQDRPQEAAGLLRGDAGRRLRGRVPAALVADARGGRDHSRHTRPAQADGAVRGGVGAAARARSASGRFAGQ
jgi:hypothetical protein